MTDSSTSIAPGAQPFFLSGRSIGVIILHGYGGSIGDYRTFAQHLNAKGYTVSGVRLAGHGQGVETLAQSHIDDWRRSVDDAVNDMRPQVNQIFIVGSSFGGTLALDYVERNHGGISGLIVVNPAFSYRGGGIFQNLLLRILRVITPNLPKLGLSAADRAKYADLGSTTHWPISGILETSQVIKRDVVPTLHTVKAPILLLVNANDPIVSGKGSSVLSKHLPDRLLTSVALTGKTHRPFRDPASVLFMAEQTDQFIRRVANQGEK